MRALLLMLLNCRKLLLKLFALDIFLEPNEMQVLIGSAKKKKFVLVIERENVHAQTQPEEKKSNKKRANSYVWLVNKN